MRPQKLKHSNTAGGKDETTVKLPGAEEQPPAACVRHVGEGSLSGNHTQSLSSGPTAKAGTLQLGHQGQAGAPALTFGSARLKAICILSLGSFFR